MPSLNSYISFDVKFVFTDKAILQLIAKTSLTDAQRAGMYGYFSVTQPDGIEVAGSFASPDVSFAANGKQTFDVALRLGSDGKYVRGGYDITFHARHPDYTDGTFNRVFGIQFEPVKQNIRATFDYYTPLIKFEDLTNYAVSEYSIVQQSSNWRSFLGIGGYAQSLLGELTPLLNDNFYATEYDTRYTKQVLYQNTTDTWLYVLQELYYTNVTDAYVPLQMSALVAYLEAAKKKAEASCYEPTAQALYEKAATLYTLIRGLVCARNTTNLKKYFEEFYSLTHYGAPLAYPKNGAVIPAYDFTTGCGGSGSGGTTGGYRNYQVSITATTDGQTVLPLALPVGARIISITKGITPLESNQYTYSLNQITLVGIAMSVTDGEGEKLFVTYEIQE